MTTPATEPVDAPVLIAGGGLVGLSTAMFLAQHGVRSIAIERLRGGSGLPRAAHFHLRTLELFRLAGIEEQVKAQSAARVPARGRDRDDGHPGRAQAGRHHPEPQRRRRGDQPVPPALRQPARARADPARPGRAGRRHRGRRSRGRRRRAGRPRSDRHRAGDGRRIIAVVARPLPRWRRRCPQRRARAAGHAVRGARSVLEQHDDLLHRRPAAADGGQAAQRHLHQQRHVRWLLPARQELRVRLPRGQHGGRRHVDRGGRRGVRHERAPVDRAGARRRRGARPRRRIDGLARWRSTADVARSYQTGRVLLAGDAAHIMPPNGGFGGNTGIHDAHNLAWKLAMVLQGHADPALLATYDAERRPVGQFTVEQAYTRYVRRTAPYLGVDDAPPLAPDLDIELGYLYRSGAVIPDDDDLPEGHDDPRHTRGRPGSRLPHVWVERDGQQVSTIDLVRQRVRRAHRVGRRGVGGRHRRGGQRPPGSPLRCSRHRR